MTQPTSQEGWEAVYTAAFRETASQRGWSDENIDSGWLDNLPSDAWRERGFKGDDPCKVAAEDVIECEVEAS